MIYLFLIVFLVFLSYHYDYKKNHRNKTFFYKLVLLLFVLVAGLRFRLGVDTSRYLYGFYHETPYLWEISWDDLSLGTDPLFTLLNSIVYSLGGRFYIVQLIQSFIVNFLIFKYIKKHSTYIFTCVLFYLILKYLPFNMEEMRASISISICLFANDYIIEKKWLKGYALYVIACFFHVSAVVMLIVPLLTFLRFNFIGIIVLLGAFVAGKIGMLLFESDFQILAFNDALTSKTNGYLDSENLIKNSNGILFFIINIVPLYLYAIWSVLYLKKKDNKDIFVYEPFLMLFLVFLSLQTGMYILYRFVSFFIIYFIFFAVSLFYKLIENGRKRMTGSLACCRSLCLYSFLLLTSLAYYFTKDMKHRFYPYSSVIEKSIDEKRERQIKDFGGEPYRYNEY